MEPVDSVYPTIILLSHTTDTSSTALHALNRFFTQQPNVKSIIQILNPLDSPEQATTINADDDPPRTVLGPPPQRLHGMLPFRYLWQFLGSIWSIISVSTPHTLGIGLNPLNAAALLFCKFLFGRPKTVIFFCCDYSRNRFPSRLLSLIYVYVDTLARNYSNRTWNVSPRMHNIVSGGMRHNGRQFLVPNGVASQFADHSRLPYPSTLVSTIEFVYIGSLEPGKGIDTLLDVISTCKLVDKWRLTVIGDGSLREHLTVRASALGISENCRFIGFVPNNEIHDILSHMHIGFAPYCSTPDYNFYCDPVKVKDYLASGVFTVVSNVPWIGARLEELGIGRAYVTPEDLKEAIEKTAALLSGTMYNRESLFQTARSAKIVSTWDEVFETGLSELT